MDVTRKKSKRPTVKRSPRKAASGPYRKEISDAVLEAAAGGPPVLLAFILKIVLKERITDKEVQLICDCFYHD